MPKQGRGKKDETGPPKARSDKIAPGPEKIPTYAQQSVQRLGDEEEGPYRFSTEQERELAAEGIWPERQWTIWKHAVTRGIQAQ